MQSAAQVLGQASPAEYMPDLPDGGVIALVAAAAAVALWWAARWCYRGMHRAGSTAACVAAASLLAKVALVHVAMGSPDFEPKAAANISVELWEGALESGPSAFLEVPTFALSTLVAAPAFALFGPHQEFLAINNCLAIGLAGLVLAGALARCVSVRSGLAALLLLTWNPSSVYWGIHALRDPFIVLAVAFSAAGLVYLSAPSHFGRGVRCLIASALLIVAVRPEILFVPLGCAVVAAIAFAPARPLRLAVALLLGIGAIALPWVVASELGMDRLNMESLEETAGARLDRAVRLPAGGVGGSSFYADTQEYMQLGMGDRFVTQFAGLVASPYPVWPRERTDWLVAVESLGWGLAIALPWLACGKRPASRDAVRLARAASVCAVASLAVYAPLTINAGNAFRLRYSVVPLAILALSPLLAPARQRRVIILEPEREPIYASPNPAAR